MSERFKYSLNGVYRSENHAPHVARNNFPRVPIGSAGGINGWFIKLIRINGQNNYPVVYPWIFADNKPTLRLRGSFYVIKKDGSSCYQTRGRLITAPNFGAYGEDMHIADLLNQDNGYLDDDGGLTVGYGIHIDGIQGVDGIWKFNLNDKLFNPNETLTIEYTDPEDGILKVLYGHRQPLSFHSPHFQKELTKLEGIRRHEKWVIEECLQIAHGVRIPLDENVLRIASVAHDNKLRNVVQYADQQLVAVYWCLKITEIKQSDLLLLENCFEFGLRHFLARLVDAYDCLKVFLFDHCIKFGLRHYLTHLVKHFECLEDLEDIIERLDIDKMSGEAMKTFAAKIFDLGT